MFLTKLPSGQYVPSYESDWEHSRKIAVGTEIRATKPRNVKFLRKGFALLDLGHDNQDKFESKEIYRKVITIRAGFYTEVPDLKGAIQFIPDSLSFENMKAETFENWFDATLKVIAGDLELSEDNIMAEIAGFY